MVYFTLRLAFVYMFKKDLTLFCWICQQFLLICQLQSHKLKQNFCLFYVYIEANNLDMKMLLVLALFLLI